MKPDTAYAIDQARWLSQPEQWRPLMAVATDDRDHDDPHGNVQAADRQFRQVMDLWRSLPTSHPTDVMVRLRG